MIKITSTLFFLMVALFTHDLHSNITAIDLININNEFKEVIEDVNNPKRDLYYSMGLALYALETDRFEIYFYLAERDGFVISYKSTLQEPNVLHTTILHTAVRKDNAELLSQLLDRCSISKSIYEFSYSSITRNKMEKSFNILGLALLPEYINYDLVKTILEHGVNPDSWICANDQDPRSPRDKLYPEFMFSHLDVLELLLQHGSTIKKEVLLNKYIIGQNQEGVRLLITWGVEVNWSHLELALKFNTNPKGEEIALLLFEVYDQKSL